MLILWHYSISADDMYLSSWLTYIIFSFLLELTHGWIDQSKNKKQTKKAESIHYFFDPTAYICD